jgi:DNA repair exonuclease SbcCD nuclease subunit
VALRFLQLGDLHLGATMSGLPGEVANTLREATRNVVSDVFSSVAERNIDLILMPGDLFEAAGEDPASELRFIYQLASRVDPVPVVISPGNHDPYGPYSPYAREEVPRNVVLFTNPAFEARETRVGTIVGRAFQVGETFSGLDWSTLPSSPAPGILMMHASVLGTLDDRRHKDAIVPVTQAGLEERGYNYVALGHYHTRQEYRRRGSGTIFAAYSGCPQGQGWDEFGDKGCLEGYIDQHGVELQFIPTSRHTWQRRTLELPPSHAANADERLSENINELRSGLGPHDLLSLKVHGRWPASQRQRIEEQLRLIDNAVWFSRGADVSGVEYMPELVGPSQSHVIQEFLARCDSRIEEDSEESEVWQLARYLGHRLLSGHGLPEEVAW